MRLAAVALSCLLLLLGCDQGSAEPEPENGPPPYDGPGVIDPSPYADELVSFTPGTLAGHGQDLMPEVIFGPPDGKGSGAGTSVDVVSLGVGGEIVLGFSGREVLDGPGPDLVVFENAFWVGGDPAQPWAELGEVSVSDDGVVWHTFPCDTTGSGSGQWPGCAGWQPTLEYDPDEVVPLWPPMAGGDPFDLADLSLDAVRFVRIRDLSQDGEGPSAGFDLDAVGAVHISE